MSSYSSDGSTACRSLLKRLQEPGRLLHRVSRGTSSKLLNIQEEAGQLRCRLDALQRWLCWLAVVVLVCVLLLVIVVAVQYQRLISRIPKTKVGTQLAYMLEREKLCFACDDLRLGPSQEEDAMLNVFRCHNDTSRCCVETPLQLWDLLELAIERRHRIKMAGGDVRLLNATGKRKFHNSVAAHLLGSSHQVDNDKSSRGQLLPIDEWIHDQDLAFTLPELYSQGRLLVPEDGVYFVYSHLSFLEVVDVLGRDRNGSLLLKQCPSLSHSIARYNMLYPVDGEEQLMHSSVTMKWNPERAFGEGSSYQGALFFLRQGDEIFVKGSNLALLAGNPKANFFGLFKIS